jgi:hypothetical protein
MEAIPQCQPWYVSSVLLGRKCAHEGPDTLKLYTKAHGAKVGQMLICPIFALCTYRYSQTTNLIINLDHDEWILDDDSKILAEYGIGMWLCKCISAGADYLAENETEISFFNRELYEEFKKNPEVRSLSICLQTCTDVLIDEMVALAVVAQQSNSVFSICTL